MFHSDYPKWAIWELVFIFVFQLQALGYFLPQGFVFSIKFHSDYPK